MLSPVTTKGSMLLAVLLQIPYQMLNDDIHGIAIPANWTCWSARTMGTGLSSLVSVLRTALVTMLILVRIRAEEALASAHFGDDQIAYCAHESGSFQRL